MPWITTESGKHINTDWFDNENKKQSQIEDNEAQAAVLNGKAGVLSADNTILLKDGAYKVSVFGAKNVPRAKVFSVANKFFRSDYHDIYNYKKDGYVKDDKGRKFYLKNASLSKDGKTIYV